MFPSRVIAGSPKFYEIFDVIAIWQRLICSETLNRCTTKKMQSCVTVCMEVEGRKLQRCMASDFPKLNNGLLARNVKTEIPHRCWRQFFLKRRKVVYLNEKPPPWIVAT